MLFENGEKKWRRWRRRRLWNNTHSSSTSILIFARRSMIIVCALLPNQLKNRRMFIWSVRNFRPASSLPILGSRDYTQNHHFMLYGLMETGQTATKSVLLPSLSITAAFFIKQIKKCNTRISNRWFFVIYQHFIGAGILSNLFELNFGWTESLRMRHTRAWRAEH